MQLTYSILSWSAWSPSKPTADDWLIQPNNHQVDINNSTSPKLSQVPAMQRRRYSRLTKMMLTVALEADVSPQTRSIFSSRHGELNRTIGLLEDVIADEALSPIGFSQSVHNTASGIFTILTQNHSAVTSIAAGEQTLPQAMIEAYAQLIDKDEPILFVYGDDPVPPIFSPYVDEPQLPLAFAWQLATATSSSPITLKLTDKIPQTAKPLDIEQLLYAIATKKSVKGIIKEWYWELNVAA